MSDGSSKKKKQVSKFLSLTFTVPAAMCAVQQGATGAVSYAGKYIRDLFFTPEKNLDESYAVSSESLLSKDISFEEMLDTSKNPKIGSMLKTLKDARELDERENNDFFDTLDKFAEMQKEESVMVTLKENTPTMVIGDIHSNQAALECAVTTFLQKKNSGENIQMLFLGDYGDRGAQGPNEYSNSVKVWYTLMKLKLLFPGEIFLLRGNHETQAMSENYGGSQSFYTAFRSKNNVANLLDDLYKKFFNNLPLCAEIKQNGKKYLAMHGSAPVMFKNYENLFNDLKSSKDKNLPFTADFSAKYLNKDKQNKEIAISDVNLENLITEIDNIGNPSFSYYRLPGYKYLLEESKKVDRKNKKEIVDFEKKLNNDINLYFNNSRKSKDLFFDEKEEKAYCFDGRYTVGEQFMWNDFSKEGSTISEQNGVSARKNNHRGTGCFCYPEDLEKISAESGYEGFISAHNHRIKDGQEVMNIEKRNSQGQEKKKMQYIITMGSPNMNYEGNPGNMLFINNGNLENARIKYDVFWKKEKYETEINEKDKTKFTNLFI